MLAIALTLVVSAIVFLVIYPYTYWKRKGFAYLHPSIPFGNLNSFRQRKESFGVCAANLYNESREAIVGVYLFFRPVLLVRDADLVKRILVNDFQYFHDRGVHSNEEENPLSAGLFFLEGKRWTHLRKILSPLFTPGRLKAMFPIIEEVSRRMVEHLNSKIDSYENIVDVKDIATRYSNDVIVSIIFGVEIDSFKNDDHIFTKIRNDFADEGILRNLTNAGVFLAPKLVDYFRLGKVNKELESMLRQQIEETMSYRRRTNTERNDFLQLLMELRDDDKNKSEESEKLTITITEIVAHSFLFFAAGWDTSAETISFCFHELSHNTEIMEKLIKNINQTIEEHGGIVSYETIQNMKYLDMVVLETLRKYPPLPFLNRLCMQDYQVPNNDVIIKAGTPILISPLGLQRDPKYFNDPYKFDPDRFGPGEDTCNSNAFIPFGVGPRACIGQRQGRMVVKMGIIQLLKNFKWEATRVKHELEFDVNTVTIMPKHGVNLKISKLKFEKENS